ncbi:hypothetical protein [Flavobacterium sp.]|uniref:hypothetical protein n=1 Tax=Flavobacterium sp. TaxID=239 RepID=UPI00120D3002|nr:hypothetical protein [Flavobacterium sp.]RZJ71634.1 MAG: hypothetical protein EOO49_09775 [Flavobacterium sp.]
MPDYRKTVKFVKSSPRDFCRFSIAGINLFFTGIRSIKTGTGCSTPNVQSEALRKSWTAVWNLEFGFDSYRDGILEFLIRILPEKMTILRFESQDLFRRKLGFGAWISEFSK